MEWVIRFLALTETSYIITLQLEYSHLSLARPRLLNLLLKVLLLHLSQQRKSQWRHWPSHRKVRLRWLCKKVRVENFSISVFLCMCLQWSVSSRSSCCTVQKREVSLPSQSAPCHAAYCVTCLLLKFHVELLPDAENTMERERERLLLSHYFFYNLVVFGVVEAKGFPSSSVYRQNIYSCISTTWRWHAFPSLCSALTPEALHSLGMTMLDQSPSTGPFNY